LTQEDISDIFKKIAGELLRVEKVKPDPLNLSVNTGVGKRFIIKDNKLVLSSINGKHFL
jgi:hypothetical protein